MKLYVGGTTGSNSSPQHNLISNQNATSGTTTTGSTANGTINNQQMNNPMQNSMMNHQQQHLMNSFMSAQNDISLINLTDADLNADLNFDPAAVIDGDGTADALNV